MLIGLMVVVISQCICISNYHVVHLKYMQFLFVNHTSIKLETFFKNLGSKKKRKKKNSLYR